MIKLNFNNYKIYYDAVISRCLNRGCKAKSRVSAEPKHIVKYPPRHLSALLRGRVYLGITSCVIFFGLIFSFVFAKPSFEVDLQSAPTVSATNVTPASQAAGGKIVINSQIIDVSGVANAKILIKDAANILVESIDIYDDGFHYDAAASDNIFGTDWLTPTNFPIGTYKVFVIATDTLGNVFNPAVEQTTFIITAAAPVLTTIDIVPANPTVIVGGTQIFTASPKDQFGNAIAATINWTSSAPAVGTIISTGAYTASFTALTPGLVTINANKGAAVFGTATVIVVAQTLTTLDIAPLTPSLQVGETVTFTSDPKDQAGNPMPATVVWTSGTPAVGTINASSGVFTAAGIGTTTVTAVSGLIVRTTVVTVSAALLKLTTINVDPATLTIAVGGNKAFTALPKDQFGGDFPVAIVWTSSDPAVGTVDVAGNFTALTAGLVTITAKNGLISGTSSVSVTVAAPLSVSIMSPINGSVFKLGDTINFDSSPVTGGVAPYTYSWVSTYSFGSMFFPAPMDGNIGGSASFTSNSLLANRDARDITLTVTDSVGTTATGVVKISVYYPAAIIQSPAASATFLQILDTVIFKAGECGSKMPCAYTWTSNINGFLSNLQTFETNGLFLGNHIITLTVTDGFIPAQTSTSTVNITVAAVASLTAKINLPTSDFVAANSLVIFNSLVAGGLEPYIYEWKSNIDGSISTASTFSTNTLSVGTHTITLKVTDALAATDIKNITLQIVGCSTLFGDQVSPGKLDIVFVGDHYSLAQMPQFLADVTADKNKLFSFSPFDNAFYQNKINVHYVNYAGDLGCSVTVVGANSFLNCDSARAASIATICPNDQIAVISNLDSAAVGNAGVNSGILFTSNNTGMFVHEFGHSFGGLNDEFNYGYASLDNVDPLPFPNQPNCDKAGCPKWSAIPTGCVGLGNVLTCTDTGLINGTAYYYQAAAVNADGTGSLLGAEEISVVPAVAAATIPFPLTTLSAIAGDTQITLAWAAPNNGGSPITSYNVYRGTSSGTEVLLGAGDCSGVGNVLTCTDSGLTNGIKYYYKVTAVNAVGVSSLAGANEVNAEPSTVINAPSPVAVLTTSIGDTQTTLNWSAPADGGSPITSYNVYRGTSSGTEVLLGAGDCSGVGNVLTCTDSGLTNGIKYYYQVAAVNTIGTGSLFGATESIVVPVAAGNAPNPVSVLFGISGNTKVILNWIAPAANASPITNYLIYRSTVPGAEISLGSGTVCSAGCGYSNWFKSSVNSVMRSLSANFFNTVSINYLINKLNYY